MGGKEDTGNEEELGSEKNILYNNKRVVISPKFPFHWRNFAWGAEELLRISGTTMRKPVFGVRGESVTCHRILALTQPRRLILPSGIGVSL